MQLFYNELIFAKINSARLAGLAPLVTILFFSTLYVDTANSKPRRNRRFSWFRIANDPSRSCWIAAPSFNRLTGGITNEVRVAWAWPLWGPTQRVVTKKYFPKGWSSPQESAEVALIEDFPEIRRDGVTVRGPRILAHDTERHFVVMELVADDQAQPWPNGRDAMRRISESTAKTLGQAIGWWLRAWQEQTSLTRSEWKTLPLEIQTVVMENRFRSAMEIVRSSFTGQEQSRLIKYLSDQHELVGFSNDEEIPLFPSHGDIWAANFLVEPTRHSVVVLDPETGGPVRGAAVGHDLGFLIGYSRILAHANPTSSTNANAFARGAVHGYLEHADQTAMSLRARLEIAGGIMSAAAAITAFHSHAKIDGVPFGELQFGLSATERADVGEVSVELFRDLSRLLDEPGQLAKSTTIPRSENDLIAELVTWAHHGSAAQGTAERQ